MKLLVWSNNGSGVPPAVCERKRFKLSKLRLPTIIILHTITAHQFEPNKATLSSALHIYSVCEGGCSKLTGKLWMNEVETTGGASSFLSVGWAKECESSVLQHFSNHKPRNILLSPPPLDLVSILLCCNSTQLKIRVAKGLNISCKFPETFQKFMKISQKSGNFATLVIILQWLSMFFFSSIRCMKSFMVYYVMLFQNYITFFVLWNRAPPHTNKDNVDQDFQAMLLLFTKAKTIRNHV